MSPFFSHLPRVLLLAAWLLIGSVPLQANETAEDLPTVKLSPAMRAAEINPFSAVPCDRLHAARAETEREQAQLYQRKQQCLQRYQSFSPDRLSTGASTPPQGGGQ